MNVIIHRDSDDGQYSAVLESKPEYEGYGDTIPDALRSLADALEEGV